jgi:hypothetical protein
MVDRVVVLQIETLASDDQRIGRRSLLDVMAVTPKLSDFPADLVIGAL